MTDVKADVDFETIYKEGLKPVIRRCKAEGGITLTTLGELRGALGYGRLGKWVLGDIAFALDKMNLGFFPTNLLQAEINDEPRQSQELWVYLQDGSPIASVLDVVINPADASKVRSTLLSITLQGAAEELTPEQKLERIRNIVG